MNVAGPHVDRFAHHQVDQPDDRGTVVIVGDHRLGGFGLRKVDGRFRKLLQHRVDRLGFALAVMAVDRRLNGVDRSDGDLDVAVQDETQLVENFDRHGIADGDRQ